MSPALGGIMNISLKTQPALSGTSGKIKYHKKMEVRGKDMDVKS